MIRPEEALPRALPNGELYESAYRLIAVMSSTERGLLPLNPWEGAEWRSMQPARALAITAIENFLLINANVIVPPLCRGRHGAIAWADASGFRHACGTLVREFLVCGPRPM